MATSAVAPPDPKPPTIDDALRTLRSLPPLSLVATYLLQQVSQENIAFKKVADVIRTDAPLSADTLRIANSALIGPRFPVTGVLHALAMLGLNRVRSLVTTAALKNLVGPADATPALRRCWRHNLACAFLAEEAAAKCDLDRDYAYTAGLLHDIGRLVMMSAWRARYSEFLDAATPDAAALLPLERQDFGIPHTRAGFALLRDWKLPPIFAEVADRHHDPSVPGAQDVLAVVQFSCSFADTLGFSAIDQPTAEQEPNPPLALRPLIPGTLDEIYARIGERINALECCLG
jgi:putative nucleotidyltransferase with HDIG domain